MKTLLKTTSLIICSLLLITSCAFHARNADNIPAALRHLSLSSTRPHDAFTSDLKNLLRSLHVRIENSPKLAPYSLKISHLRFSQSHSAITTTNQPISLSYNLSVSLSLTNAQDHTVILDTTLSAAHSVTQNASQVYTPHTASLIKQDLQRDILSQFYYLLISNHTRKKLNHAH
jgi:outer membrane lipopolysaccharide assembly protein LptE/RlpB